MRYGIIKTVGIKERDVMEGSIKKVSYETNKICTMQSHKVAISD